MHMLSAFCVCRVLHKAIWQGWDGGGRKKKEKEKKCGLRSRLSTADNLHEPNSFKEPVEWSEAFLGEGRRSIP